MTLGPKTKIALSVAAVLGVAALGLVMLANRSTSASASDSSGGGFPNILFSPSAGPAQIATSGSVQTDATTGLPGAPDSGMNSILAALSAAQSQITANATSGYNTNATDLFKQLPGTLSAAGLTDFFASQTQDAGKTELITHAIYKAPPPAATQPQTVIQNFINNAAPAPFNNYDWSGPNGTS